MIFTFFALFLGVPNLFGAFQLKLAVYKNYANFTKNISKVDREKYRKNILIEEKNNLYYITSILYEKEKDAKKALLAYKKVFADAFIAEVEQKKAVGEERLSKAKAVPDNEVPLLDAKILLENKTVYICEEERVSGINSTIIRMDFKKEYVVYTKQKKGTLPLNIAYSFDKDRVVLPMSGVDFQYKIYKEGKDFLSVQGFINGKKSKIFRYYFDERAALACVAKD